MWDVGVNPQTKSADVTENKKNCIEIIFSIFILVSSEEMKYYRVQNIRIHVQCAHQINRHLFAHKQAKSSQTTVCTRCCVCVPRCFTLNELFYTDTSVL